MEHIAGTMPMPTHGRSWRLVKSKIKSNNAKARILQVYLILWCGNCVTSPLTAGSNSGKVLIESIFMLEIRMIDVL
jgi:hypothetical protein